MEKPMEESTPTSFRSEGIQKVIKMFGSSFELDKKVTARLKKDCGLSTKAFNDLLKSFTKAYESHKVFRHNKTEMNIFFCDWLMFSREGGYNASNYLDFEFYGKTLEEQRSFLGEEHRNKLRLLCNAPVSVNMIKDKAIFNRMYADCIRRDWLYVADCSLEDFKHFVSKHPRFFAKPTLGSLGKGAKIVNVAPNSDINAVFSRYRGQKMILEEIISQHEELNQFCPSTINTIRVNTLLDPHGAVHIVMACGRFGRVGGVVDNFHGGGCSVGIDPLTGEIISDAINMFHERFEKHPDTGKKFRGFRYPCWAKVRAAVIKMAKLIPSVRHIGWDIALTDAGTVELVEGNSHPDLDLQQAADSIGRLHFYKPLVEELEQYNRKLFETIGYRINDIDNFGASYQTPPTKRETRAEFALKHLIEGCRSVLDVGCRKTKFAKKFCPSGVEYHPLDYIKYDDETIECDFRTGIFPEIKVDTCLEVVTAEYVELLPEFLENLCNAARRQVLMVCRPIDRETVPKYRWLKPYVTDFTEKFLIESIEKKGFYLHQLKTLPDNKAVILYDFRRR